MENSKYWLFILFLLLYLTIILLNVLLITVIHQNKELQQPMNLFICVLSINEIYGSTVLLPTIMALFLSETHELTIKWCIAQVYFVHTYASAEFFILAVMGYDRYVAICNPLQYHSIISNSKTGKLAVLAGMYPAVVFGCFYSLTIRLRFCGKVMPKMYCVNMELVKNSCSPAPYISIVGLVLILFLIMPQLLLIVFSYAKILRVCRKLPRESQRNALKTCLPHLVSLTNFTIAAFFEVIQSRFNMTHIAIEARNFLSLYFIILPPLTNPVLYGLGTRMVRVKILKLFVRYRMLPTLLAKAVAVASV